MSIYIYAWDKCLRSENASVLLVSPRWRWYLIVSVCWVVCEAEGELWLAEAQSSTEIPASVFNLQNLQPRCRLPPCSPTSSPHSPHRQPINGPICLLIQSSSISNRNAPDIFPLERPSAGPFDLFSHSPPSNLFFSPLAEIGPLREDSYLAPFAHWQKR